MSDPVTILKQARELISDEKDWCQGAYQNSLGQHCAVGALSVTACGKNKPKAIYFESEISPSYQALEALREVTPTKDVVAYNDTHDHECVLNLFDAAIERLEAKN